MTNNKFFVSPNFAPLINSIRFENKETYFAPAGGEILISGDFLGANSLDSESVNFVHPAVELRSSNGKEQQICAISNVTENAAKCHLPTVSGFYEVSLETEKDGKSSISRDKLPVASKHYDLMIFPVIESLHKDQSGMLHLFGKGFERSCEVTIGDWKCNKDENSFSSEHLSCEPIEPRFDLKK